MSLADLAASGQTWSMAWNFCIRCGEVGYLTQGWGFLCAACAPRIQDLAAWQYIDVGDQELTVHYLYQYTNPLRQIILDCKIRSKLSNYRYLVELFTNHPQAIYLASQADYIIPAPSSLWGRLRGRFDLAYGAAQRLANIEQRPLRIAPRQLAWRLQKRARQQEKQWHAPPAPRRLAKNHWWRGKRLLLLDDIITSGLTMATLANFYPGARIRGLCLAGSSKLISIDRKELTTHDPDATSVF